MFPVRAVAFTIALPFALGTFIYSRDGEALYAAARSSPLGLSEPGLFKIEFSPVRATAIAGSESFGIVGLAAARDRILISGNHGRGAIMESGLFELNLTDGKSRLLIPNHEGRRDAVWAWSHLSASPDGLRVAAMRHRTLEIIDLARRTTTALPANLMLGAWSPDGRWLAAIDWKKDKTILMDAATLTPRRTLPESNVDWSPDSRYLLGTKKYDFLFCGPYSGTLQAIDIETGKTTTIRSSRCKVNQATIGWVVRGISQ